MAGGDRLWISPGNVIRSLVGAEGVSDRDRVVVTGLRLPRALAALCIGAALASAGAAFQGLFRNPLVEPRILGVSSAAAVGAAGGILLGMPQPSIQMAAFVMGLGGMGLSWALARRFGASLLVLVIAGIVVSSGFDALLGLTRYVADPHSVLPGITHWLLGGLGTVRWAALWPLLAACGVGFTALMLLRWRLNALSLDEREAHALGVPVRRLRLVVILAGTLLTAASVATAGVISWVGLLVPHAARALVGPGHARLLPASALLGALLVLCLDTIARSAVPGEIPLGILTGLLGAPLFALLLLRRLAGAGGWR